MLELSDLPAFNATMNSLAATCLFAGFFAIKKGKKELHRKLMMSAFVCSAIFLASYLVYHFNYPTKPFPELGWIKTVYLSILFPHILLAVVMLPMIFKTFYHAYKAHKEVGFENHNHWSQHKKIAKPTFYIWSYVSVTGVIIYFMLYHWFEG